MTKSSAQFTTQEEAEQKRQAWAWVQLSAHATQPENCKTFRIHKTQVLHVFFYISLMDKPVSEKGTDKIFGISRHLYIIWEDEGVLVVHDFPISPNQGLSIERSFTCDNSQLLNLTGLM